MQANRCIVRRGTAVIRAEGMQGDVFRERAQIGIAVFEPQRHTRERPKTGRKQGFDTTTGGCAGPDGAPGAAPVDVSTRAEAAGGINFAIFCKSSG
jgi:hypothetical protein